MSPKYERDDVDEVRERADIVQVIGEHVRLRKAGRDWKGLCPFHQEKTPSFVVNPDKGLYFCLAGETRVITAYGAREIGSLAGTIQRVLTTGPGGTRWVEAPFFAFGEQEVLEVVLSRNGLEKTVRATAEHRWFVRQKGRKGRGREVVTEDLRPGHVLTSCYSQAPSSYQPSRPLTPSPFGIARGITFGDGTRLNRGSVAYLYGEKDLALRKWFPLSDVYERGDRITVCDLPAYFKDEFPSMDESHSYLYGWLAGYFAADGDVSADACISLNSASRKNLEYVRDICTRIGIGTFGIREYARRGFKKAAGAEEFYEGPVYRLTIAGADLTPEFFLVDEHRRRFESHPKAFERRHWVVREVRRTGAVEDVFCAVVPDTHAFTLEDNILTGNCHGCGAGGSVFTFLEQTEGLSFPEAVETLARRFGIELREVAGGARKQESSRAKLYTLQEQAVRRYREFLNAKDAEPVRAYLESRGITPEIAEKYSVGFGGWKRDAVVRAAHRSGYKGEELLTAGLATRDQGGLRDTFYGRVLFPIFDPSGRPVGFGGRVLPEEFRENNEIPDAPKYLNSRESPIFKKSRILYGTNWARAEVIQRKRLVLVEGYTDVIAMQAAGLGETVATCGTSLTEDHMKEISSRFGDVRIVLCLDADAAGQNAMSKDRTEELAGAFSPGDQVRGSGWVPIGRGWLPEVHVANLPQGKDPADFVRAEGAHGVTTVLEAAVPLVEFLLRRAIEGADLRSPDGRTRAVRRGVDVLRQVGDTLMRHEYALWLADRTGVDAQEVVRALDTQEASSRRRTSPQPRTEAPVALTGHHRIEHEALRSILAYPNLIDDEELQPTEDDFTLPLHRSLFRLLTTEMTERGDIDAGRIAARVQDPELRRIASQLSVGDTPEDVVARDTLRHVKLNTVGRHIVELKARMRTLDPNRDSAAYDAVFEELLELEMQKRKLSSAG